MNSHPSDKPSTLPFDPADLRQAVDVMKKGGVILYPTDTIWGIGCDATNPEAVRRVFAIKRRPDSKALISLVPSADWLDTYVEDVPEVAYQLIKASVRPTTIVYDRGIRLAPNLLADDGSVGIRVTSEIFSSRLASSLRRPVVSTSANVSGSPSPRYFNEIDPAVIEAVDYVVAYRRDDLSPASPSSVIRLGSGGLISILRP